MISSHKEEISEAIAPSKHYEKLNYVSPKLYQLSSDKTKGGSDNAVAESAGTNDYGS